MAHWPEVRLAVLFGSAALGDSRPASDVDVGLILEPYSAPLLFRVEAALGRVTGRPLHVVLLEEASPLLRFEVSRDGVLLCEREEGLWTDFKTRAMLDWWDWAPTAREIQRAIIQRLKAQVSYGKT